MRPPDRVLVASLRWLDLLRRNTVIQTDALLASDPRYSDLTRTQYHADFDWLLTAGLITPCPQGFRPCPALRNLPSADSALAVMAKALELDPPGWLQDADSCLVDPDDLPEDTDALRAALGLSGRQALNAARRAQSKVDLQARERIGAAGEMGLIRLLEAQWPGSTTHVSVDDDTAGYDIAFNLGALTWHLEVKSTSRRGRLVIYVSRNEFVTGEADRFWRLVVIGLDHGDQPSALATVSQDTLAQRSPRDTHHDADWASARYVLGPQDLTPGLCLGGDTPVYEIQPSAPFAWLPHPRSGLQS